MFLVFAPTVYFTLEQELFGEADRWLAPLSQQVAQSVVEKPEMLSTDTATVDPATGILVPTSQLQRNWLEQFTASGVYVELLDPNGQRIAGSANLQGRALPVPDGTFASAWWGKPASYTAEMEGQRYRGMLAPIPGSTEPRGFVLVSTFSPVRGRCPAETGSPAGSRKRLRPAARRGRRLADRQERAEADRGDNQHRQSDRPLAGVRPATESRKIPRRGGQAGCHLQRDAGKPRLGIRRPDAGSSPTHLTNCDLPSPRFAATSRSFAAPWTRPERTGRRRWTTWPRRWTG